MLRCCCDDMLLRMPALSKKKMLGVKYKYAVQFHERSLPDFTSIYMRACIILRFPFPDASYTALSSGWRVDRADTIVRDSLPAKQTVGHNTC